MTEPINTQREGLRRQLLGMGGWKGGSKRSYLMGVRSDVESTFSAGSPRPDQRRCRRRRRQRRRRRRGRSCCRCRSRCCRRRPGRFLGQGRHREEHLVRPAAVSRAGGLPQAEGDAGRVSAQYPFGGCGSRTEDTTVTGKKSSVRLKA